MLAKRVIVLFVLGLAAGCGKPTGVPGPSPANTQQLPFDRESRAKGISPSQSLIPPTTRLAEGTSITIRLQKILSSASAHAGDSFEGAVDEPVVVDGQTFIPRGAAVDGHVLDAQAASRGPKPGYLRIALVSVNVAGKTVLIETSSVFVKGKGGSNGVRGSTAGDQQNVEFSPERRLTFHLTQPADLP